MANHKSNPLAVNVVMGAPPDVQYVRCDISESVCGAFTIRGDGTVNIPAISLEVSEAEERFLSDDDYWLDSGVTPVALAAGLKVQRLTFSNLGAKHARLKLDNTAGAAGTVQKIWGHGKPG